MRGVAKAAERRLRELFCARFGEARGPLALASAPGRVELAGNHTDHQGGCTISAAIDRRACALAAPNGTDEARVLMDGFGEAVPRPWAAGGGVRRVERARAGHDGGLRARRRSIARL